MPHALSAYRLRTAVRRVAAIALLCLAAAVACALSGCSGLGGGSASSGSGSFTPTFTPAAFDAQAAQTDGVNAIDLSHASEGYIGATSTSEGKLKLYVQCGDASYNYDLPGTGEPIIVPVNMGNGTYVAHVMQNTEANRYVELFSATADVQLVNEMAPYVRPNVYCNYNENSACVALARELTGTASSESEAFDAIFTYIKDNIDYDRDKAAMLKDATGYVPNPDETLATGRGVCFDYASLTAAMLRSVGIPCKILTGYVSPDNIYHAWDMIYVDGSWTSMHISTPNGDWARADMTFEAAGGGDSIGDGSTYSDRYTY